MSNSNEGLGDLLLVGDWEGQGKEVYCEVDETKIYKRLFRNIKYIFWNPCFCFDAGCVIVIVITRCGYEISKYNTRTIHGYSSSDSDQRRAAH